MSKKPRGLLSGSPPDLTSLRKRTVEDIIRDAQKLSEEERKWLVSKLLESLKK